MSFSPTNRMFERSGRDSRQLQAQNEFGRRELRTQTFDIVTDFRDIADEVSRRKRAKVELLDRGHETAAVVAQFALTFGRFTSTKSSSP
jgi:hypothetical protein